MRNSVSEFPRLGDLSVLKVLTPGRAGHIICRACCKMKMQGPLFKSQGKVSQKILKYKPFSFLLWSLTTYHGVLNLLFKVVLPRVWGIFAGRAQILTGAQGLQPEIEHASTNAALSCQVLSSASPVLMPCAPAGGRVSQSFPLVHCSNQQQTVTPKGFQLPCQDMFRSWNEGGQEVCPCHSPSKCAMTHFWS